MLASKMIRLAAKCDLGRRVTTRFLRSLSYKPSYREIAFCVSPEQMMSLGVRERRTVELNQKFLNLPLEYFDTGLESPQVLEYVDDMEKFCDDFPVHLKTEPIDLGDSLDQEASGRRIFNATEAILAKRGKSIKGLTFAIQGLGNVGSWIARLVHEAGGKVVAVSDVTRALKNKEGIDVTALLKHMDSNGNLADFSGGDSMDVIELLYSECDVLIPGALGGALKRRIAVDVKAKLAIETADSVISSFSNTVLQRKGVVTLDDIFSDDEDSGNLGYLGWLKARGFMWGKVKD